MPLRRLLVLAYYFPPLGGSGVQRVAKLVMFLPQFGWQPTVVTARPGAYVAYDEDLAAEVAAAGVDVIQTASIDPTRLARRVTPGGGAGKGRLGTLLEWLAVPDNKLGWLPFARRAARRAHAHFPFEAVYATAPPYTGLLLGALMARQFRVPLFLDLRDDWLGNPRHRYPTASHRALHARLERFAFARAAGISVISEAMAEAVRARHPDLVERIRTMPQGFDPDDFDPSLSPPRDGRFRLLYTGMFYDAQRPDTFLHGLRGFLDAHPEARVAATFAGHVPQTFDALVGQLHLQDVVEFVGYLPHRDVTRLQQQADVLWMTVGHRPGAAGISTGKLFEYMGTRRPILGLVPEGTAAEALRAYGASWVVDPDDTAAVARALEAAWEAWREEALPVPEEALVQQHDRRRIAEQVARWMEEERRN